ncbi:MAG: glycosyltransferase [Candidatus Bathyarchaeota archaeon]|nr:glycosyltransferase [Candidatus Bathyarchaeota archaeon]
MKLIFEKQCNRLMKPIVSIGICVKNCETSVKEAIDSVCIQDFPHELMEVIIVDDGSEDRTLLMVVNLASKMDIQVKVFHSEWRGLGFARNLIVEQARGKYIVWVDGDMILPIDHVRKQVRFMEQNPKVGIAKAKYGMVPKENIVATLENVPFMVYDTKPGMVNLKLPGTGGAIYRVKAIRQVGGFDSGLKGTGEDQDAAYRVRASGWFLDQSPAVFYEERVRTWKGLWDKYFWYGYGDHDLYCKNRKIFSLYRMNPIAGFIAGTMYVLDTHRLISYKGVFLLPFHFAFKMVAWCLGFAKARLDFAHVNYPLREQSK